MREKIPSSAAMQAAINGVKIDSRKKYPWDTLTVGESFKVEYSEIKLKTLTNYANRVGIKLGKLFHIVDHGEAIGYEVGLIGDRLAKDAPPWAKQKKIPTVTVVTDTEPTGAERFKNMGFKS